MASRPPSTKDLWTSPERVQALQRDADSVEASSRAHSELLIRAAALSPGSRVLDLACGSGDPALLMAAAVGTSGHVTGIDLSEGILDVARARASKRGLTNVEFREARAESIPFPDGSFDRVTSRFGAMFFEDLPAAASEARRVLRPGGRLALLVWGPSDQPYFQATVGVALRYAGLAELPVEKRLPFRFAEPGELETALEKAGWKNVHAEAHSVPWVWEGTPEDVVTNWREGSVFFRPILDAVPEDRRADLWRSVTDRFRPFYDGKRVSVPEKVRVVIGDR